MDQTPKNGAKSRNALKSKNVLKSWINQTIHFATVHTSQHSSLIMELGTDIHNKRSEVKVLCGQMETTPLK